MTTYNTEFQACPDCGELTYFIDLPEGCETGEDALALDIDEVKALRKTLEKIEKKTKKYVGEVRFG